MAKISPKKESDKPRKPFAASFEKINKDLAPAINGLKNLDFSRFTKALGFLSVDSFAEIEAQAYGDEVQINPDLYKLISKPDPDPFPPHIMQQLQDLQAKLRGYDNEDSPTATAQADEDTIPLTDVTDVAGYYFFAGIPKKYATKEVAYNELAEKHGFASAEYFKKRYLYISKPKRRRAPTKTALSRLQRIKRALLNAGHDTELIDSDIGLIKATL